MHMLRTSLLCVAAWAAMHTAALALDRPAWMDQPGIVMAGSWEEPSFRARRMGRTDYTLPAELQAQYAREHTPEMIAQLKDLGVNFVMIHCYKGAGLKTEHEGMEDAKRFTRLAHQAGLRVGAYIGGTMLYDRLFEEEPDAPQWQAFGPHGEPLYYHPTQQFRYAVVRNHPGFIEYLKKPVRFAVEEMHADLIHFDNFGTGAATYDSFSKKKFREFLQARGKMPHDPPLRGTSNTDPLVRDWEDYKCQALTDHYAAMSRYIRGLNPQCGVECNPGGVGSGGAAVAGIDHARLLPLGNAFWDENYGTDWSEKTATAQTRIRTLKVGELFNNSTFLYCESALDLAESMAFNVNCLGSVSWFEWGKMETAHLTGKPIPKELKTYIRFFLDHQDLYRHWRSVADVAVLRTFADANFSLRKSYPIEQSLIQAHVAWRIIFDEQVDDLASYRVLVVPDKPWLTAEQQRKIARFGQRGGLVVRSADIPDPKAFAKTVHDRLRVLVDAPRSVALELRQQNTPRRVLIHLVNYNARQPVKNVAVKLRLKSGTVQSVRLMSPDPATCRPLPFETAPRGCSFVVPECNVYAAVVIDGIGL
jgi:hypothetical protein